MSWLELLAGGLAVAGVFCALRSWQIRRDDRDYFAREYDDWHARDGEQ